MEKVDEHSLLIRYVYSVTLLKIIISGVSVYRRIITQHISGIMISDVCDYVLFG